MASVLVELKMSTLFIRRVHRIICLLILAALAMWAQNQNSLPKIQSLTCPANMVQVSGTKATCTVTLSKQAPKGGFVVAVTFDPPLPVLLTAIPQVTVPEGKTFTSFQVTVK